MSLDVALRRLTPPPHSGAAPLTPRAIGWWAFGAFAFLCALCLQQHMQPVYLAKLDARQLALWRAAPALSLHFTYGSVRLAGTLASAGDRERLSRRASEVMGAHAVIDALRVEPRSVPDDWLDSVVTALLLAGKKIENGSIEFSGTRVSVRGTVADAQTLRSLEDALQTALSEYARLDPQLSIAPKHARLRAALARLAPAGALLFAPRSAVLQAASKRTLDRVAALLRKSTARVDIIGYADAVGAADLSRRLSELRAQAVRTHLIERGVAPQQLRAFGAGESAAGALPNRRAELRVAEAQ